MRLGDCARYSKIMKKKFRIKYRYIVSAIALEREKAYIALIKVEDVVAKSTKYLYGIYFPKSLEDVITRMTEWGKSHVDDCAKGLLLSPDVFWKWAEDNRLLGLGSWSYEYDIQRGSVENHIPNTDIAFVI